MTHMVFEAALCCASISQYEIMTPQRESVTHFHMHSGSVCSTRGMCSTVMAIGCTLTVDLWWRHLRCLLMGHTVVLWSSVDLMCDSTTCDSLTSNGHMTPGVGAHTP